MSKQEKGMKIKAKYVHTNLIAENWKKLTGFYQDVFGCKVVPPERDFKGKSIEAGTGISDVHLQGVHLRLPGYMDDGPTLEIFSYSPQVDKQHTIINRPGYGHIAFQVDDVFKAKEIVLQNGGREIGEIVTLQVSPDSKVTWCYVTDPEDNVIELQSWT
jgi:catechol 2,3-dioxygenase-like lactoylglutathione lyase family enzyme